ncbi:MAG: hypothetical protein WCA08_24840 [Desulfoferrobacter sp.]
MNQIGRLRELEIEQLLELQRLVTTTKQGPLGQDLQAHLEYAEKKLQEFSDLMHRADTSRVVIKALDEVLGADISRTTPPEVRLKIYDIKYREDAQLNAVSSAGLLVQLFEI